MQHDLRRAPASWCLRSDSGEAAAFGVLANPPDPLTLLPRSPRESVTKDPLDRHFTPDAIARAIVATIEITPSEIVEPSVGGGSFVQACRARWPSVPVHGVDLDPGAEGLRLCDSHDVDDWLSASTRLSADLIVGNPPFTGAIAIEHVRAALALRPRVCALILPLAYLGVGRWRKLLAVHPPAWIRTIPGRPWPKRIRETACYEWRADWHETYSRTAPLVLL